MSNPGNAEITQIFKRLRSSPSNKICFDCGAKNPTWSSVTYGVFICIDCSGIHRGMGVHLTFVRSTQLDSNWTWQQLRQMQLGGNENAATFFRQHHVDTKDILQKYKSRAAQLYRDKLHHLATQAMRLHGTKVFIDKLERRVSQNSSDGGGDNDPDFFDQDIHKPATIDEAPMQKYETSNGKISKAVTDDGSAPNVEAALVMSPTQAQEKLGTRKPTIGQRKPAKKGGLGAKKAGGLGAQKVKKDFAEIEKEAEMADQMKYKIEEDRKIDEAKRIEDESKAAANMRLAYQDLSLQQKKQEEKLRKVDAKKAAQVERLGMGASSSKSGIGHSVMNQMNTIVQEEPLASKGYESRSSKREEDDFEIIGSDWRSSSYGSKNRNDNAYSTTTNNNDDDAFFDGFGGSSSKSNNWEKEFEVMKLSSDTSSYKNNATTSATSNWSNSFEESSSERNSRSSRSAFNAKSSNPTPQEDAVKKFGGAKAISSDMFFGNQDSGNEGNSASRFAGQSSISSAQYFNRPDELTYAQKYGPYGPGITTPDMEDVKESVKQGVSKVAGRLSGMASGVMTQLQVKSQVYGTSPTEIKKISTDKIRSLSSSLMDKYGY